MFSGPGHRPGPGPAPPSCGKQGAARGRMAPAVGPWENTTGTMGRNSARPGSRWRPATRMRQQDLQSAGGFADIGEDRPAEPVMRGVEVSHAPALSSATQLTPEGQIAGKALWRMDAFPQIFPGQQQAPRHKVRASPARETSHRRPYKVAQVNDCDVSPGWLRSVRQVASRRAPNLINGQAHIRRADARMLTGVEAGTRDRALTSSPSLNTIAY